MPLNSTPSLHVLGLGDHVAIEISLSSFYFTIKGLSLNIRKLSGLTLSETLSHIDQEDKVGESNTPVCARKL